MQKFVLVSLFLGLFPALLLANPPRKVEMVLNPKNGNWIISAEHPVADSTSHYIDLYTVSVDGKEVLKSEFKVQATKAKQLQEVAIPQIKKGSKVAVNAKCNKFGSKTYSFTVE